MIKVDWKAPDTLPEIPEGTEEHFWLAVEVTKPNKPVEIKTFLGQYQNRPLNQNAEVPLGDEEPLVNTDGDPVSSVGWVACQSHYDFDNFYEFINFSDEYKLMGWAEYEAPDFTPVK